MKFYKAAGLGLLFSAALALVVTPFVSAQEPGSQSIEVMAFSADDQEGDGAFAAPMIITSSETTDGGGMTSSMRIMSGDGNVMMMGGGPFMMGGGDDFSMLQNPSVQKDLELVDDQLQQVLEMQKSHADQMRDAMGGFKNGFTTEGVEKLKETLTKLKDKQQNELNGLLLPHQKDRLKQVALQMRMQSMGTAGALASEKIAEELGIDAEQKERLKKRSTELNAELQEKIAELTANAKDELLNELTPDQQEKLKALTGDQFESNMNDWSERFQNTERRQRRSRSGGGEGAADDGN